MARADPAITSFNGGELSPYVGGRPDTAKYASGCRRMFNYLPRVTGAAVRRPGTQYVGVPKNNTAAQLLGFEASTSAVTVLELGTGYMRFWDGATRLPILNASGVWGINLGVFPSAELAVNFDYTYPLASAQSNDVMWLCDGTHYPQKLSRIAQYQFQIAQMGDGVNAPGPYKDVSPTQAITLAFGAQSGAGVSMVASSALFAAKNIGEYWYCQAPKTDSVTPWETAKAITAGMVRTSNGRNYVALTSGTTGTVRPSHSIGARWDGTGASGVQWDYSDDNYGEVLITGVTSATAATCTVVTKLPLSLTAGGASARWARAAWNVDEGYPVAVCFYQGRLCFARGQQVWCSVAGDFENFTTMDAQQTLPDLALNVTLANRKNDRALWMAAMPSANDLIIGTANGAYALSENVSSEAFGPGNARARSIAGAGCAPVPPAATGNTLVFVQRGGRKVRRIVYDFSSSGYVTPDMTAFASHIASKLPSTPLLTPTGQIKRLASTQSPDPVIWAFGSMGGNYFHSLTFDAEQQVEAWATHQLGGVGFTNPDVTQPPVAPCVIDAVAVLSPNLRDDDVWMITTRFGVGTPAGAPRKLEVLGPHVCYRSNDKLPFSYDEITDPVDAQFLDYGSRAFVAGDGLSIPAYGMPDGVTASALVDGYTVPDQVIAAGKFALTHKSRGAGNARIGFNYLSILHPMPAIGQSQTGTPWGKRSRIMAVAVRLWNSVGGRLQASEDVNAVFDRVNMRTQSDAMDTATPLKSGDYVIDMPAGYAGGRDDPTQAEIVWIQDQPLPSTVLGMFIQMSVADA
jgi:hypothetical protein